MAHSPGFDRLRRLFAMATWAKRHGVNPSEAEEAFELFLMDRRTVLKGLAASAAMAVVPVGLQGCGKKDPEPNGGGDKVVVVGGGIAGLHAAWRLKEAGVDVTLYEAQDRIGGRMWTARDKLPNGLLFEIGGELIDSNHETMHALAREFDIQLDDRWEFEPPGMIRETWWVGGAQVTNETLLEQTMVIAEVMGMQVDAAESDDAEFEKYDNMSLQQWLDEYLPKDTYPELHEVLRVAFVGEYGLEADEQSVLNMHYLFGYDSTDEFLIFGESDERWHTHEGNDAIVAALADAVGSESITLESKLVKAAGPKNGPYTLTFEGPDGSTDVEAAHVVFALPFTTLRKVDLADLELSDEKRDIIDNIGYGTNAKIMGEFSSRPWWDVHNQSGLLTTDLGAQQGWDTTIGQDESKGGVWTNFVGGDQGVASGEGTAADWFAATAADLEQIWPGSQAAWTGVAERMHWPTFQWTLGSYTCYRPGQWAYWSLEGAREGNVHFCGEHCSLEFQGWMEGAAETGGLVAAEVLDDLGVAKSSLLERIVARKLAVPQACYHGDQIGKQRWVRRSRRLRQGAGPVLIPARL